MAFLVFWYESFRIFSEFFILLTESILLCCVSFFSAERAECVLYVHKHIYADGHFLILQQFANFGYAYRFVKQTDCLPSFVCTDSNSCLVLGSRGVKTCFLYVWTALLVLKCIMILDVCFFFMGGC